MVNSVIARPAVLLCLMLGSAMFASAALDILPLSEIRAGQRGVGRTIFTGDKIENLLEIARHPVSLETPIDEEGDSTFGDFVEGADALEIVVAEKFF